MSDYGKLTRVIAKSLESFPFIRNSLKEVVHRLNYIIHRRREKLVLNYSLKLIEPSEWAKTSKIEHDSIFFGYYDKTPWNEEMSKMAFHSIVENKVNIIVFDKLTSSYKHVGESYAWNYQQGSMLTWLSSNSLIFNTYENNLFKSKIVNTEGEVERVFEYPIQCIAPDKKSALSLNYSRLMKLRPDYGYHQDAANFGLNLSYDSDGIWFLDMNSGVGKLIISLQDLLNNHQTPEMLVSDHKVNHFCYSPSGDQFLFLHRWLGTKGKYSRLYCGSKDGKELNILLDDRMVSHYCWLDDDTIITYARTDKSGDKYYEIDTNSGEVKIVGEGILDKYGDGHPMVSNNKKWLLTDTYPNKARMRKLILFNLKSNELFVLGEFYAPWKFNGTKRCDLHPRWSSDDSYISIDSAHEGNRKSYLIDVSHFTKKHM